MRAALPWLFAFVGGVAWLLVVVRAIHVITSISTDQPELWLFDWRVYAAGSQDMLDRTLYRVPLEYPGWTLPIDEYNLPPLSAVWPLLFSWMPDQLGGSVWALAGIAAWLGVWWLLASRVLRIPHAWAFVAGGALLYSRTQAFELHLVLGNINDLVLLLVAAFTVLHQRGRPRSAGVILALAIATKLWPAALLVVVARERRWAELRWCAGTLALSGALTVLWLGYDALPDMVDALRVSAPVAPGNPVLWVTWLREHAPWWPPWGALVIAAMLLLAPARGWTGIGLGILAGITLVPNIWSHYLPTLVFGAGLVLAGAARGATIRNRVGREPIDPGDG